MLSVVGRAALRQNLAREAGQLKADRFARSAGGWILVISGWPPVKTRRLASAPG
jgi:hypothetical protein